MSSLRFLLVLPRRAARSTDHRPQLVVASGRTEARADRTDMLWVSEAAPSVRLLPHSGLLVGSVHGYSDEEELAEALEDLSRDPNPAITARRLATNIWGRYLAILWDEAANDHVLFRDPSGFLPCYRIVLADRVCIASDIDLLITTTGHKPSIDWQEVRGHLRQWEVRSKRTCLRGIDELSPGYAEWADSPSRHPSRIWSPWEFTSPATTPSYDEASEVLRGLVEQCASAHCDRAPTRPVLVPVSGGIDSSIVCAGLARAGREFACVTIATEDRSGDERTYARALAGHFGVGLQESFYDPCHIDLARSSSDHLPRPVTKPFVQETRRLFRQAAENVGAQIILDGNGGDSLFCYLHSSSPISDRLIMEGPGARVVRTAIDVARITGCSLPTLARVAARHLVRRPRLDLPTSDHLLTRVNDAAYKRAILTPYFDDTTERQYGKHAHVAMLLRMQNFIEGYERSGAISLISPLLSQPLVEYCLSIPTWYWCNGGINRAFARHAFRDDLPPAILSRTSKAGPDSFLHRIFQLNRTLLHERLLEGHLATEGILDRAATASALASGGRAVQRLLELAEVEAWIESWMQRRPVVAL